jgi:DNA repair photolyase
VIDPFWGEFLTSPIPLDLALNYCSHSCAFCFANLNSPKRTADVPKIERLFDDHIDRSSVPARLLQEGYPVLLSNRVDPFANSNYKISLALIDKMVADGIRVAIQTRGGRGVDEALAMLPPSCWYISICQNDDSLRKQIEPGAPRIEERFELIRKVRAAGHRAVVALNPLVPDWLPAPEKTLAKAKEAGAEGVWVETLHLSTDQIGRMTSRERGAIGDPLLQLSRKRRAPAAFAAHRDLVLRLAEDMGLAPFSAGWHRPTAFWKPYEDTYPFLFPTMQGWVNRCHAELSDGAVVHFADFEQWSLDSLPFEGESLNITHYVGATAREVVKERKLPSQITYSDLLRVVWQEPRMSGCPARVRCFAYAGRRNGAGWDGYVDDGGMPVMTFTAHPEGFGDYFVESEVLAA